MNELESLCLHNIVGLQTQESKISQGCKLLHVVVAAQGIMLT